MGVINTIIAGLRSEGLNETQIQDEIVSFNSNPPAEIMSVIRLLEETVSG